MEGNYSLAFGASEPQVPAFMVVMPNGKEMHLHACGVKPLNMTPSVVLSKLMGVDTMFHSFYEFTRRPFVCELLSLPAPLP